MDLGYFHCWVSMMFRLLKTNCLQHFYHSTHQSINEYIMITLIYESGNLSIILINLFKNLLTRQSVNQRTNISKNHVNNPTTGRSSNKPIYLFADQPHKRISSISKTSNRIIKPTLPEIGSKTTIFIS